jgi:GNAT superfamily N-acetyltransferase
MHVQVTVVETIPAQHADRIAALLLGCFGASAARRSDHADRFCSQADAWRHVLGIERDKVVGFATIYRRSILWNGSTIALGGLGDVCTDPDWRHQGVATAVVRRAMTELEQAGDQLAYLCAAVHDPGIVHLYGQIGFAPLGRPHTYDGKSGRTYTDDDAMIAPVGSREVFDDVMRSDQPLHIGRGNW